MSGGAVARPRCGPMKLYYSQTSPYARIARVAAIESGLASAIEYVQVRNRDPQSPLLRHSPVCRVPTLVAGSLVLAEARNICAYLDSLTGTARLFPYEGHRFWENVGFESMVIGSLDGIATWIRENRREEHERSEFILKTERARADRCLDHFEASMESATERELLQPGIFCGIALACALAIMDLNRLIEGWAVPRPNLARWYRDYTERPSMCATSPCRASTSI